MKKYRLKVDTPWAEKGTIYSNVQPHHQEFWIGETDAYGFSNTGPSDYPYLFEPIEEKSDEEKLADWLRQQIENGIEWEQSAKNLLAAGVRVEDLK